MLLVFLCIELVTFSVNSPIKYQILINICVIHFLLIANVKLLTFTTYFK